MGTEPIDDQRNPDDVARDRDPDEIRQEIADTRSRMDDTLDQIEYRVSPGRIKERQQARVRGRWQRMKSSVMGEGDDSRGHSSGPSRGDQAKEQGRQAAQAVKDAPDQARAQTRGNPLAAGMIAFGAGALIGSLLPSSQKEQEAAGRLRDQAEDPVKQELRDVAQRSKEDLQPAAQEAADQTKQRAQEATQETKDEAQSRADNVKQEAQGAAERTRQS